MIDIYFKVSMRFSVLKLNLIPGMVGLHTDAEVTLKKKLIQKIVIFAQTGWIEICKF